MTEWKDEPATRASVYALRKYLEEELASIKAMLEEVKAQPQEAPSGWKRMARIPVRSADLCEVCHGARLMLNDDGDAIDCVCTKAKGAA